MGAATGAVAAEIHDGGIGGPVQTLGARSPIRRARPTPRPRRWAALKFFTPDERAFIEAATNRLIPPDLTGPSAIEANVPFIDRQLAGPMGRGDHYYLGGPSHRLGNDKVGWISVPRCSSAASASTGLRGHARKSGKRGDG